MAMQSGCQQAERASARVAHFCSRIGYFFAKTHNPYAICFAWLHFFGTRPALICTLLHKTGASQDTRAW
ncbi:MAG: hypothetical protein ACRCWL_14450, partial [Aeromonas sp.]